MPTDGVLRAEVVETLARALAAPPAALDDATGPGDLPSWDSFGHVEAILALERRYGVRFTPDEAVAMTSVGRIVEAVGRKRR